MLGSYEPEKNRTHSLLFFLLVWGSLTTHSAHGATVALNNGDTISGELLQLSGDTLSFKSDIFGKVDIPWQRVSRLVSDDGVRVRLADGSTATGRVVVDPNGSVQIDQGRLVRSQPLTRADLAALNPPVIDNRVKYSGRLDLGGSFNRGNSTGDQLNLNGELVARTPQHRYTVGVEVNEAKADGIKTASNSRLVTQYDVFLSEKNFLFLNAKAEHDDFADLNLRTSVGAGYGRQFIDNDVSTLSGQVGLNYVNEDRYLASDRAFPGLSLGMKYDRNFFDKKLVYFQNMNVDTNLNDARDTLVRARLGLRVPVAKGVNVSTQLNVDYYNLPAPGTGKTDTALVFSVGYGF